MGNSPIQAVLGHAPRTLTFAALPILRRKKRKEKWFLLTYEKKGFSFSRNWRLVPPTQRGEQKMTTKNPSDRRAVEAAFSLAKPANGSQRIGTKNQFHNRPILSL